jgi:hypothetical protein
MQQQCHFSWYRTAAADRPENDRSRKSAGLPAG